MVPLYFLRMAAKTYKQSIQNLSIIDRKKIVDEILNGKSIDNVSNECMVTTYSIHAYLTKVIRNKKILSSLGVDMDVFKKLSQPTTGSSFFPVSQYSSSEFNYGGPLNRELSKLPNLITINDAQNI